MPKIIRNQQIVEDDAILVVPAEGEMPSDLRLPQGGRAIVPLAVFEARRDELLAREGGIGVMLKGTDDPAAIAADLGRLALVAVEFPKFTDGRGYSIAALLRTRYGYAGELRAVGDVLRDQFYFMRRCGFDTVVPKAGKYDDAQLEAALASFGAFSTPYQGAVDEPAPLFRRADRGTLSA